MNRFACELVRSGGIGWIKAVQGVLLHRPPRLRRSARSACARGRRLDLLAGADGPSKPFNHALQFGWMAWRDYSGGEMTNWGAHGVDQVQWALGMCQTGPVEIWPITPGTSGKVGMRYANGVVVSYELESGPMGGAIFTGEDCKIEINRNKFVTNPPDFVKNPPAAAGGGSVGRGGLDRTAAHPELARLDQDPPASQCRRRDRPPLDQRLPLGQYRPAARPPPVEPGDGTVRRRYGSQHVSEPAQRKGYELPEA